MKKNLLMSFVLMLGLVFQALAQERVITGKITSGEDGSVLPGVSISAKGTSRGVTSNIDGTYKISLPNEAKTLIFTFIGFSKQEVIIGSKSVIDVKMAVDVSELNEVVVVGYGTQTKRSLTGALSSVTAKQIADIPITSIEQSLQGRAAGVQITQNSGTPGGGIQVRVRGTNSIQGSNEPLYVVDGIILNTNNTTQISTGGQLLNPISDIPPGDIESMEVLKDAAASAIYGSRAANGVVLITTKHGKSGKTKVTLNYSTGFAQTWNRINTLTGPQYSALFNDMVFNRFGSINSQGQIVGFGDVWPTKGALTSFVQDLLTGIPEADRNGIRTAASYDNPSLTKYSTNWQNEIFRTAPIRNYEIAISGGNDRTQYSISGGYFDQDGIVRNSGFTRLHGRLNLDHSVSSKFKVGTGIGLTRSTVNRLENDNNIYGVISTAILATSDVPIRDDKGRYYKDPASIVENPVAAFAEPTQLVTNYRVLANAYAQYELIKGLTFRSQIGTDYLTSNEDQYKPTTTNAGVGVKGQGTSTSYTATRWQWDNIMNYSTTIAGKHNINATAVAAYEERNQATLYIQTTGFPSNDFKKNVSGSVKVDAQSNGTSIGISSYVGRLNYDYDGKYLFSASARYDGASNLGKNYRWGLFPSVSGGWLISEENFMKDVKKISNLKLRASYGATGNNIINTNNNTDNINAGNFPSLGLYGSGTNYIGQGGISPSQVPNPDLKWEKTNQLDIAIEIGLFNNRVNFTAEYYNKQTSDLLYPVNIPATSGFSVATKNVGKMENVGWEFSLNTRNIDTKDFKWSTDFNITFNRNKLLSFNTDVEPQEAGFASWLAAGYPIGSFRGYRVEKIFQTQDEINALNTIANNKFGTNGAKAYYQVAATAPGDIKFKDLNGDGVITAADQEVLGSAQPDFFGGMTNNFYYKGFDLSVFLQYSYGNKIYNATRSFSAAMSSVFGQTDETLRRWTPQNTNTDVPRAIYGDPNSNSRDSDRWLEDGSYARIKNLILGYTLPAKLIERTKLFSRVRIYGQAQNLWTFTKYKGFDPEVNTFSGSNVALGTDFLVYPQARTYTFGVQLDF